MSYSLNTCTISGNLTRDPESRTTNGGMTITRLSVAVAGREKVNGEWQDRPDFLDVEVFGDQAERAAEWLAKGAHVEVAGRLRQDRWKDKDGNKRNAVKVIAAYLVFPRKGESASSDRGDAFAQEAQAAFAAADIETVLDAQDVDIPF